MSISASISPPSGLTCPHPPCLPQPRGTPPGHCAGPAPGRSVEAGGRQQQGWRDGRQGRGPAGGRAARTQQPWPRLCPCFTLPDTALTHSPPMKSCRWGGGGVDRAERRSGGGRGSRQQAAAQGEAAKSESDSLAASACRRTPLAPGDLHKCRDRRKPAPGAGLADLRHAPARNSQSRAAPCSPRLPEPPITKHLIGQVGQQRVDGAILQWRRRDARGDGRGDTDHLSADGGRKGGERSAGAAGSAGWSPGGLHRWTLTRIRRGSVSTHVPSPLSSPGRPGASSSPNRPHRQSWGV